MFTGRQVVTSGGQVGGSSDRSGQSRVPSQFCPGPTHTPVAQILPSHDATGVAGAEGASSVSGEEG